MAPTNALQQANASTAVPGIGGNSLMVQNGAGAVLVAKLIAQKNLPEIFGLLGLVSDCATPERLLADLRLLPCYLPDPSEGEIWREE